MLIESEFFWNRQDLFMENAVCREGTDHKRNRDWWTIEERECRHFEDHGSVARRASDNPNLLRTRKHHWWLPPSTLSATLPPNRTSIRNLGHPHEEPFRPTPASHAKSVAIFSLADKSFGSTSSLLDLPCR